MDAALELHAKEQAEEIEKQQIARIKKLIAEHEEELVEAVTKRVEKKVRKEVRKKVMLEAAKTLLENTDLSVEEIANNLDLPVEAVQNLKESSGNS